MRRIPPFKVWTIPQIARLMGDTVYKAVKFCESNNIPIMRRGRTRVVVHAHIERKFPEVTDEIVYGGDDD